VSKRKMTPKQQVLQKFPGAVATLDKFGRYRITHNRVLGTGAKEKDAWADAAKVKPS
jgi:hypothetical protein